MMTSSKKLLETRAACCQTFVELIVIVMNFHSQRLVLICDRRYLNRRSSHPVPESRRKCDEACEKRWRYGRNQVKFVFLRKRNSDND
jgi:hypothetical protein